MASENKLRCVSLVTGGAGGIGVAVCRALAQAGQQVAIVDMDGSRAAAAAQTLQDEGLSAFAAACDVSSATAVKSLRQSLLDQGQTVSVLVNLAGVVRNAMLTRVTDEDFTLTLKSHLLSTLNTMRAFGPDMKRQHFGRIINCSSIAVMGSLGGSSYGAAKGGIEGLSRTAAIEFAPYGITVNVIAPGVIGAGMFLKGPKDYQEKITSRTPMKRAGTAEEVAACVRFFATPEASFVTGQTLFVCGGLTIGALG